MSNEYDTIVRQGETRDEYFIRLCDSKNLLGISWGKIADLMEENFDEVYKEDKYRKEYGNYLMKKAVGATSDSKYEKMMYLKTALSDERIEVNAALRRLSREDTLKEIAKNFAEQMTAKKLLPNYPEIEESDGVKYAILCLSDWHYGIEIDNVWNRFNPAVARIRISKLKNEVIKYCKKNNVTRLCVVGLGDFISGRIHTGIRISNRIDVISQTMEVSEILAEFLNDLSEHFNVFYTDCEDNHSRLEPVKENSLDLENLQRIIHWYIEHRFEQSLNVHVLNCNASPDIIQFQLCVSEDVTWKVAGVHGDKDKITNVVSNLCLMTKTNYDLILTAHMHHFQCDEQNDVVVVSNGSLMGTDDYAKNLRFSSKPSQTLIIVSNETPCEAIYRIVLD